MRNNIEDAKLYNPWLASGVRHGLTVLPDAAANIDADMGPVIYMTPTASRILTLPVIDASMRGLTFYFITQAAFTLVVKNQAAVTIATIPAVVGGTGMIVCTGDATVNGGWVGGVA